MQSRRIASLLLAVLLTGCTGSNSHRGTSGSTRSSTSQSTNTSGEYDPDIEKIPVNFTVINDFHGQVDEEASDYRVGLAKMTTYLKDRKAAGDILLCSGDNYQGSYQCYEDKGKLVSETFKEIGFDAYTIGNHEFDWGVENVSKFEEYLGDSFLGANIYDYPKTGSEWTKSSLGKKYKIIKLNEGTKYEVKIGVIGVIGQDQITSITSTYVEDYIFLDPTDIVNSLADELREEKGCDIVVADYHSADADTSIAEHVDAVFEAHTHRYAKKEVEGVPFLQASAYSRGVSTVSFWLNKNNGVISLQDYDYKYLNAMNLVPDAGVQAKIDAWKANHTSVFNDVIGNNAAGGEISSGAMSKFYGKIAYDKAKSLPEFSSYDIKAAIFNTSRRELKEGAFTYSNLFETHPFLNDIYIISSSDKNISTQLSYSYGYKDPSFTSTGSSSVYHDVIVFNYNGFHIGVNDSYEKYYNCFPSAFTSGAAHPPVKLPFNCLDEAVNWLGVHTNITTSDFSGEGFFG